jgi:CD36 family
LTYYGTWAGSTGFDPDNYLTAIEDMPQSQYWSLMRNNTALAEYFEQSALGSTLAPYFENADVYRDRCANPEAFKGMWEMSEMLACPTIYTFPHFLGSGEVVVESTGSNISTWAPNALQHGYSLAVEPFTGFAVQGHKTYQVNHLVSATPNLYPNLWVAPGTAAATGMANDFVTVPVFWVRMWWQPTDSAALLIRGIIVAEDILYYVLVLSFPITGWAMLGSALFILKFGKDGKKRAKAISAIEKSKARKKFITSHEQDMVRGLSRIARGSIGVVLPQPISEGLSEAGEYNNTPTLEELEAGVAGENIAAPGKKETVSVEIASQETSDQSRASWSMFDVESAKGRLRSPRVAPAPEVAPSLGASLLVLQADGSSSSSNGREEPLLRGSSGSEDSGVKTSSSAGSETLLLKSNALPSSYLGERSSPRGNSTTGGGSGGGTGNKWQQINNSAQ